MLPREGHCSISCICHRQIPHCRRQRAALWAKSVRGLFRLKAAEGGGEDSLDQTAFRQLVKVLLLNEGGSKSVPPDKDIDAAFECEDVQHIGRIDEEDFLELYELIRSGKAKGLGSHSMVSSKYEKMRAEARKSLHHHTASTDAKAEHASTENDAASMPIVTPTAVEIAEVHVPEEKDIAPAAAAAPAAASARKE